MPVTQNPLTSGSSDSSPYETASISPGANRLIVAAIVTDGTTSTPSLSGAGLTWVLEEKQELPALPYGLYVFRALSSSPGMGVVTISAAGSDRVGWAITEFLDVNTSGSNGSGAVVQSVPATLNNSSSFSIALSGFGDTGNATFGVAGTRHNTTHTINPGSGFTEIYDIPVVLSSRRLQIQWRSDPDTTVDWTSGSTLSTWTGIALEIKGTGPQALSGTASISVTAEAEIHLDPLALSGSV